MRGSPTEEPRPSVMWLLALLPVLAAYANVGGVGFLWDDHPLIEQNVALHTLEPPWAYVRSGFWAQAFETGHSAYYRPVVTWSFAVDWALGGGSPAPFHFTNLALHLAVCSLVFVLALRRGGSALTASILTMLFGVSTRLTESVTWISGRTDVLATLFMLAAFLAADARRGVSRGLGGLWVLLALLSKEVAVVGALALLAERALSVRRKQTTWGQEGPILGAVTVALVAWLALRPASAAGPGLHQVPTFLAGLGHYAVMIVTPWNAQPQLGLVGEPEGWAIALGAGLLVGVALLAARWLRSPLPWRGVWLLAALGGLVLVSAVVLAVSTIASDRFLYFPLAFVAVVAAQRPWPRAGLAAGLVLTLGLTVSTFLRNEVWASPLRFWEHALQTSSPKNPGPPLGLADVLFELNRLEEAKALYERAERLANPRLRPTIELSLAAADSKLGNDAQALARLPSLLVERPDWLRARYALVLIHARAEDFEGARAALAAARARSDSEVLHGFAALLDSAPPRLQSADPLEQARAFHALGATRKAQDRYVSLLARPDAQLEAAKWLVLYGAEAQARAALELLRDDPAAQAAWAERFPAH